MPTHSIMAVWITMHKMADIVRAQVRNRFMIRSHGAPRGLWALLIGSLVASSGCGNDTTTSNPVSTADAYRLLQLNQHAITMSVVAPYNTVQLQATPLTAAGVPVTDAGAVQYHVIGSDTSLVVSSTGLLTAKAPTYQNAFADFPLGYDMPVSGVVASLTLQGVTLADTALVLITNVTPASPLATLSIQPPADSMAAYQSGAWLSPSTLDGYGQSQSIARLLNVTQLDAAGEPIINELVHVTSSDVNAAFTSSNDFSSYSLRCVTGVKPNSPVTFYTQTLYYGVARSDSLRVRVGYRHTATLVAYQRTPYGSLTPQLYWWPTAIDVSAPVELDFENNFADLAVDVVFDESADVQEDTIRKDFYESYGLKRQKTLGAGNIAAYVYDTVGAGVACGTAMYDGTTNAADSTCNLSYVTQQRWRMISKPGTYTYHTLFGNGGTIVVH